MRDWVMVMLAAATGCTSTVIPLDRGTTPNAGRKACEAFARGAEQEASVWSVAGYASGVVGASAIAVGAVVGESTAMDANWAQEHRNLLLTAAGGILLFTARSFFKSSDATSTAAGLATRQLANSDDKDAFKNCIEARAVWIEARQDSNAILSGLVEAQQKKLDEQQRKIDPHDDALQQPDAAIPTQAEGGPR
jgi:hypothetical protein